tara:strand:+ start:169 stop:993 length:825 start_codon:yes stop_codon:yes gene_type:complete
MYKKINKIKIIENYTNKKNLTIVTGYFDMPSKHSSNNYKTWMKSLLSYNGPMIIFTDKENYQIIKKNRQHPHTHIIIQKIEDFSTYIYKDKQNTNLGFYYEEGRSKNMNIDIYNILQLEKINFLKQAIELNKFNTRYYAWYDIGYLRNNQILPHNWPNQNKLKILHNKVVFMSIFGKDCEYDNDINEIYTYDNPPHNLLLTGGFVGLDKNKINQLYNLYIKTIDEMIKEGQWPQDQFVFTKMYCKKYNFIQKLKSREHPFVKNNGWFYMIPYFF